MNTYKIRDCYLNLIERRVLRDGKYLDLTPKNFDVLKLLFERRGNVVSKDEILGVVWNGSFVEESNLPVHVSKVRRALDAMNYQQYIETVQGCGYRFVAPVDEISQAEWDALTADIKPIKTDPGPWRFDSIAILPLYNEAQTEEYQYLADGLTESFINSLSKHKGLRVMARNTAFRYKDKIVDPKEVGDTLGVATVLTGRLRVVKDKVIIAIELTRTEDGSNLWGTQSEVDLDAIVETKAVLRNEITAFLHRDFVKDPRFRASGYHADPDSYRFFLKGKFIAERHTRLALLTAIEYFQKAISSDPGNLSAYCEIVISYLALHSSDEMSREELIRTIKPYLRVLESVPEPDDAVLFVKATCDIYINWNFSRALNTLRQAIRLNPRNVRVRYRYVGLLTWLGHHGEVLRELRTISEIDPLSYSVCQRSGRILFMMGLFDASLSHLKDALEIAPNDYLVLGLMGCVFAEQGRLDEAEEYCQKSLACHFNAEIFAQLGYVYALQGRQGDAESVIDKLKTLPFDETNPSLKFARIYMALGERDRAFELIHDAIRLKDVDVVALYCDPRWNSLKSDSRFGEFMDRIGLRSEMAESLISGIENPVD